MATFIEARVIQKIDTEAKWNTIVLNPPPYEGEIMLVSDSTGKVINIKVGDGNNQFPDLNYMFDSIQQNVNFIQVESTALPTPTIDIGYTILGAGTYTYAGQPDIVIGSEELGILYWDGSIWAIGSRIPLPSSVADAKVSSGQTNAISGDTVFKYLNGLLVGNEVSMNFTLVAGLISATTGITNSSTTWIGTTPITVSPSSTYTIYGFGNGNSGASILVNNRVAFFNNTTLLGWVGGFNVDKVTFTTPANCNNIKIQVDAGTGVGTNIPDSPYWASFKLISGSVIAIPSLNANYLSGNITTPQITSIEDELEETTTLANSLNNELFTTEEVNKYSGNLATGALTLTGGTSSTAGYSRTSNSAVNNMVSTDDTEDLYYSGAVLSSTFAGIQFYDGALTFLGFQFQGSGTWVNALVNKPSGTRYIAYCSSNTVTGKIVKIQRSFKYKSPLNIYVDSLYSGGDSDGSASKPYVTISNALTAATGLRSNIYVKKGKYRETVNFNVTSDINIIGLDGGFEILGSERLTGWVLNSEYSNVYEIPYTKVIPSPTFGVRRIFEDGKPSKPISDIDRKPHHKGLSFRLPYTEIKEVISLALASSTPGTFFYDGVKLYIHTSNSSNPNSNGFSYENSIRNTSAGGSTLNMNKLGLTNFSVKFSADRGLFLYGKIINRDNVSVFGCRTEGFRDDVCLGISYYDEGAGNGNDGINGHYKGTIPPVADLRFDGYNMIYNSPWGHDNMGDGWSHHERSNCIINNPLMENNDRCGIIPFAGASVIVNNPICINNVLHGLAATGESSDGRTGTSMVVNGGMSINSGNSNVNAQNKSVINCYGTITRNATVAEFRSFTNSIIITYNSYAYNSDSLKLKVVDGTGVVNVINTSILS